MLFKHIEVQVPLPTPLPKELGGEEGKEIIGGKHREEGIELHPRHLSTTTRAAALPLTGCSVPTQRQQPNDLHGEHKPLKINTHK